MLAFQIVIHVSLGYLGGGGIGIVAMQLFPDRVSESAFDPHVIIQSIASFYVD